MKHLAPKQKKKAIKYNSPLILMKGKQYIMNIMTAKY